VDPTIVLAYAATVAVGLTLYVAGGLLRVGDRFKVVRRPGQDAGPTPGYAIYAARSLERGKLRLPAWLEPTTLESFHGPLRRRLVLTGRLPSGTFEPRELAAALRGVCTALAEEGGADVVAVELCARPWGPSTSSDWLAMEARDRRGWSGAAPALAFVLAVPGLDRARRVEDDQEE